MHLVGGLGGFYKLPHIASFGLVGGCGRCASCTVTHCPPSPPLIIPVMSQRCANACMIHAFAVGWVRASEAMSVCRGGVGGVGGGWLHHTHLLGGWGRLTHRTPHIVSLGLMDVGRCASCTMTPPPHPPNPGDAAVLCKRMHDARLCMCVVVTTTWWGCGAECRWRVAWVRPLLLHPPHIRQLCCLQADGEASTSLVQPLSCGRARMPPFHPHCTHT